MRRLVVFMVCALLVGACSSVSQDEIDGVTTSTSLVPIGTTTSMAPPTTIASVPRGGTVTLANLAPDTLNPYGPGVGQANLRLTEAMYAGATTREARTQRLIPDLLTEVPTIENGGAVENPDGSLTIEYHIHQDAVWEDGVPVTGQDFAFTLDAVLSTEGSPLTAGYDAIDRASVVTEEKLFRFTFSQPTLGYDEMFPVVVPKHQVEGTDFATAWTDRPWLTAGPFVVEDYVAGEHLRLVHNDAYWKRDEAGASLPYLDEVLIRLIPKGEYAAAFLAKEVDVFVADSAENIGELVPLSEASGVEVSTYLRFSGNFEHLALQVGPAGAEVNPETLMADLRLRQAIAHAVDRVGLTEELLGELGQPLDSYVEVFSPSLSTAAWSQYEHDPERAIELLAEVCADLGRDCTADPIPVVLATMSGNEVRMGAVQQVADQLEEVGLLADIRPWDTSEPGNFDDINECWDDGLCEVSLWAWFNGPDVASIVAFHQIFDPRDPWVQSYGWGLSEPSASSASVARYIELVDEMKGTVDPEVLRPLFAEAEQILADELVFIPLFVAHQGAAIWEGTIGNYRPDSANGDTWNIAEWYRE